MEFAEALRIGFFVGSNSIGFGAKTGLVAGTSTLTGDADLAVAYLVGLGGSNLYFGYISDSSYSINYYISSSD